MEWEIGSMPPSGYVEKSQWAEAQIKGGLIQSQCAKCNLWFFPQEIEGHPCVVKKTKKVISKALQNSIDDHDEFIWTQDHLNNIFLCRVKYHENGREIFKKFGSFYIPDELDKAIELHHAVCDAVKDGGNKPLISSVLGNLFWKGLVSSSILTQESERERSK